MRASVAAAWPAFVRPYEGVLNIMYLDSKLKVTTGTGNLIDTPGGAQALAWFKRDDSRATDPEVATEWHMIKSHTELAHTDRAGWAYYDVATLHIKQETIDYLLAVKTAQFWDRLVKTLPELDSFPADAQLAIMDESWQNGPAFLDLIDAKTGKYVWEGTRAALLAQDFNGAANHVPGSGGRAKRREQLFRNAALVVGLKLDPEKLWDVETPVGPPPVVDPPVPPVTPPVDPPKPPKPPTPPPKKEDPVPVKQERIKFRGMDTARFGSVCSCLVAIIPLAEARLRAEGLLPPGGRLTFAQLSYHAGSLSAGTHAGGGTFDSQFSYAQAKVLRECGIRACPRTIQQFPTGAHNHCIVVGCPHLSWDAKQQLVDLKAGRNGLAGHGPDNGADVPWITYKQALAKYAAWFAAQQEDAVDLLTFRTKKRQPIKAAKKWQLVQVNDAGDVSFATGPCKATGTALLRFNGVPAGKSAYVRVAEYDVDSNGKATNTGAHADEWVEVPGTSGTTSYLFPFCVPVGDGAGNKTRRLRLEWHTDVEGAALELVKVSYEKKVTV